jgi:hypothetical protein
MLVGPGVEARAAGTTPASARSPYDPPSRGVSRRTYYGGADRPTGRDRMADDIQPTPEPRGALVPPVRHPPTAVAVQTPPPPPRPRRLPAADRRPWLVRALGDLVSGALDAADAVADVVRDAVGLGAGAAGRRGRP